MKIRTLQRRDHLVSRPWSARERLVVWRGLMGRFSIAVEPLLGMLFFGALTYGIIWRARVAKPHDLWILWPIFAVAALAFAAYFIFLLVTPLVAYRQTYKPIYLVDGYVRYRGPDDDSDVGGNGYVAVLFEDKDVCCEWECYGRKKLPDVTIPALAEFSEYGGLHKIDGRSTGVLPDEVPVLAVGISQNGKDY
jgi:hypothetical protein